MKHQLQNLIDNNLSQDDIKLLKELIKGEYMGYDYLSSNIYLIYELEEKWAGRNNGAWRVLEKIRWYCRVFNATSFQEVIRELLFYKIITIKISDRYHWYLERYCCARYYALLKFKAELFKIALSVPLFFEEFCYKFNNAKVYDEALLKEFKYDIVKSKKIKNCLIKVCNSYNKYNKELFGIMEEGFVWIISLSKNREKIIKDALYFYQEYSFNVAVLYLAKVFLQEIYPISIKEELDSTNKRILEFLMCSSKLGGDSIAYIQNHKLKVREYEKIYNNILKNYNCNNIDEILGILNVVRRF